LLINAVPRDFACRAVSATVILKGSVSDAGPFDATLSSSSNFVAQERHEP